MKRFLIAVGAANVILGGGIISQVHATLPVLNPSFESPNSVFEVPGGGIWTDAFFWDETGPTYDDLSGFQGLPIPDAFQLPDAAKVDTGVFYNPQFVPDQENPGQFVPNQVWVRNGSGDQIGYMFANPQPQSGQPAISMSQVLSATYLAGVDYQLMIDVGESIIVPPLGLEAPAELGIALSYFDVDDNQRHMLASLALPATDLPQAPGDKGLLLLEDVTVPLAPIAPNHPAVGQPIIIELMPLSGRSGVWTFDNVRLVPGTISGDVNGDGELTIDDAASLAEALGGIDDPLVADAVLTDLDGDGDTDNEDMRLLVEDLLLFPPGDANLDGRVSVGDVAILAANFSQSGKYYPQGNFSGAAFGELANDTVTVGDVAILAANFGAGPDVVSPASVPEPASLALLCLGGLALIRRR